MEEQKTNEEMLPVGELTVEEGAETKPALIINVHTWWTPIVGVIMLAIGLLGGYFIRPDTPVAPNEVASANPAGITNPPADPNVAANQQEMMEFLISQTRHLRGDPNAPVALIEFSDFQ